jgi:hypothetical protein
LLLIRFLLIRYEIAAPYPALYKGVQVRQRAGGLVIRAGRLFAFLTLFASLGGAANRYAQVTLIPGMMSSLTAASSNNSIAFASGNLYYSDTTANVVHKVTPSGVSTIVAGGGTNATVSYGGAATGAQLKQPAGVAVDDAGNLFIADSGNHIVRMVDSTTGNISTVAGNGTAGNTGNGGPATSASLNAPYGLTTDSRGNVYVSDITANVVRSFSPGSNIVTVAGTGAAGYSGDWGAPQAADLNAPAGLAIYEDEANDRYLYIADSGNSVIRKVDLDLYSSIITTAGAGAAGFSGDGGVATSAELIIRSG